MKYLKSGILLFFLITFLSCDEENHVRKVTCTKTSDYAYLDNYPIGLISTSDLCIEYQSVWKELFIEKNNLTDRYFNNHIELCKSDILGWNDGASFTICYKVKIGWAVAYNCDQFIIKIEKDNNLYSDLNLPRNIYLSKEYIRTAVNFQAFSSHIIKLSNVETLKFNSLSNALNCLINNAEVNTLCSNMICIDKFTGNLILEAWAQYDNEDNKCIQGRIDLINGETFIADGPCFIN